MKKWGYSKPPVEKLNRPKPTPPPPGKGSIIFDIKTMIEPLFKALNGGLDVFK
jgi:hypothetical protein